MVAETLRALGWNAFVASKDKGDRIATLSSWLKSGRLTLSPQFTDLIQEFDSYFWKDRQNNGGGNAWETVTVGDHHADLLDPLGYAVQASRSSRLRPSDRAESFTIERTHGEPARTTSLTEHRLRKAGYR